MKIRRPSLLPFCVGATILFLAGDHLIAFVGSERIQSFGHALIAWLGRPLAFGLVIVELLAGFGLMALSFLAKPEPKQEGGETPLEAIRRQVREKRERKGGE